MSGHENSKIYIEFRAYAIVSVIRSVEYRLWRRGSPHESEVHVKV
jgi:hypothetical protein